MATPKTSPQSADKTQSSFNQSAFKMIDVGSKTPTRRYAVASGKIRVGEEVFKRVAERRMPKGDVLGLAEAAGIMAAKKASDIIPLCHPLQVEQVVVHCELLERDHSIRVVCEAIATAKTGVEMEALSGVNAALLSIYDLCKGINPALWISDVHLEIKEGGKSGRWVHPAEAKAAAAQAGIAGLATPKIAHAPFQGIQFAVLTISDSCSQGKAQDLSGPALVNYIKDRGGKLAASTTVADEPKAIQEVVRTWALVKNIDVILTTGGTGVGPRDQTPDALSELEGLRWVPGVGELLRSKGAGSTPMSWLSRSSAAILGQSFIVLFPGSPNAVLEGMVALEQIIPHSLHMIHGEGHGHRGSKKK